MRTTLTFAVAALALLTGLSGAGQTREDAAALEAAGHTDQAIAAYRATVRANPEDGEAWYALGRLLHGEELRNEAAAAFEQALRLEFQPGGAHLRLGLIAIEMGEKERGTGHLSAAAAAGVPVGRMVRQFPAWKRIESDAELSRFIAGLHPCATENHRAFDFWIGEWDVYSPEGQRLGENVIETILDGCVLFESWQGARGSAGHSFNRFDEPSGLWVQRWVNDSGGALDMRGSLDGAVMVLDVGHEEGQPRQRWSWTPLEGGRVQQKAEQLDPESGEWVVVWDSIYVRKGEPFE